MCEESSDCSGCGGPDASEASGARTDRPLLRGQRRQGRMGHEGHGHGPGGHHGMRGAECDHGTGLSSRFLRPYILLLLAEEPAHGYELMSRLSDFGVGQGSMDPSVLYRVLRMMEMEGLMESKLDPSGSGPARKVYDLTDEGREMLGMWKVRLSDIAGYLKTFEKRYDKLNAGGKN